MIDPRLHFERTSRSGDGRLSRRRLAALAGGAMAAAALRPSWVVAQQTPEVMPLATPVAADAPAGTPAAATTDPTDFPLPSTLAADASPEFRAVAEVLIEAMRQHRIPGAALGILAGDREEHATFGVASINTLEPVGPGTLFQIGSLSKTYTATVVWRLIDEGALALDAPVRDYLPDFRVMDEAASAGVTIGNLLDHTAGWYADEGFDTGDGDDALARYVAERMPQLPQIFPLGEFFSYNNSAFQLLGRLIEVATGTTYNAAMANLLFAPLGLPDTLLEQAEVQRRPFAEGHYAGTINGHDALAVQSPLWTPRSVDPAGGIWSTTRDVLRYARFHLAAGTATVAGAANVVSPESLLRMREPAKAMPGLPLSIGRNWMLQEMEGIRAFMHGGDTFAGHTMFIAIPGHDFAVVMVVNNVTAGAPAEVAVVAAALANYPGLGALAGELGSIQAILVPPGTPTVSLSPDELAEYAGRYADLGTVNTFVVKDDGLEMTVEPIEQPGAWLPAIPWPTPPPGPVAFLGRDEGLTQGIARLPFVRDADGRVGWVSSGFRLIPRAESA